MILAATGEAAGLAGEAEAAICVPPGDPGALADAIRRVAADAGMRESLQRRGRAFAEANSRDAGVALLEGVLEGVVGGGVRG